MKYYFDRLNLEVTRRCNFQCRHCLRGDAQNISMSTQIVDKVFEDANGCSFLYLTGGEPLLELDILEYILDKASSFDSLLRVEITTNGSILDSSIVDAFERFCSAPLNDHLEKGGFSRKIHLVISNDDFHKKDLCEQAMEFYTPLFQKANEKLGGSVPQLELVAASPASREKKTLILAGRGKNLLKKAVEEKWNLIVPNVNNHRLKIIDNFVYCATMISAKGDVIVAVEDDSFEVYDRCSIGNILTKTLTDIIDDHQNSCLLSCNETNAFNLKNQLDTISPYTNADISTMDHVIVGLIFEINSSVLKLRQQLKKVYPALPAQRLISELPMVLHKDNLIILALRIISNTHPSIMQKLQPEIDEYVSDLVLCEDKKLAETLKKLCAATIIMKHHGLSIMMKLRSEEMKILSADAEKYVKSELVPINSTVFNCGESNIFANQSDLGLKLSQFQHANDYIKLINEMKRNSL